MNRKKKILISMTITLAIIFSVTYYLCDIYMTNRNAISNKANEATQVNTSKSELDDSIKVSLFAGQKKENELTIGDLKEELNIDGELTEAKLAEVLKNKGYALDVAASGEVIFRRDPSKALDPNKYYIGEKDGFLAIYKTDDNGTPVIESDADVFSDNKTVDSLKDGDKDKIRNFEFRYDSKEEAEENLSEFLS